MIGEAKCVRCGKNVIINITESTCKCEFCGGVFNVNDTFLTNNSTKHDVDKLLSNVNAFKLIGERSKAIKLLEYITNIYPGDYRAWWELAKIDGYFENSSGDYDRIKDSQHFKKALLVASEEEKKIIENEYYSFLVKNEEIKLQNEIYHNEKFKEITSGCYDSLNHFYCGYKKEYRDCEHDIYIIEYVEGFELEEDGLYFVSYYCRWNFRPKDAFIKKYKINRIDDNGYVYSKEKIIINNNKKVRIKKINKNKVNISGHTAFKDDRFYQEMLDIKKQKVDENDKCYIATAVYGSIDAPEVVILRKFRDRYLLKTAIGKKVVDMYYYISPPMARKLSKEKKINNIVRIILNFIVRHLVKSGANLL